MPCLVGNRGRMIAFTAAIRPINFYFIQLGHVHQTDFKERILY